MRFSTYKYHFEWGLLCHEFEQNFVSSFFMRPNMSWIWMRHCAILNEASAAMSLKKKKKKGIGCSGAWYVLPSSSSIEMMRMSGSVNHTISLQCIFIIINDFVYIIISSVCNVCEDQLSSSTKEEKQAEYYHIVILLLLC